MDTRELFLDQHAAMHSAAVGGNKMSQAERAFAVLSEEQMRDWDGFSGDALTHRRRGARTGASAR